MSDRFWVLHSLHRQRYYTGSMKSGRPSKLTPETRSNLLEALRRGSHLETACQATGVSYFTIREWVRRGEGRHSRASTPEYEKFAAEIKQAIADAEIVLVSKVRAAADRDWKAAAWILSHRYSERWSDRHRVSIEVEQRLEVELEQFFDLLQSRLPTDTFRQVLKIASEPMEKTQAAARN